MTYDKKCDQCRVRDAVLVDEGGLPKCYECEVRLQGAAIQLLRDMLAEARSGEDIAAYDAAMREEFAREIAKVQAELECVRKERDGLAIAPLWYPSEIVEMPLATALRERDEARVALDTANAALAVALDDLADTQDDVDTLRAELVRYTAVYGDPDAPVDLSSFAVGKPDAPLTGSFPWGRDKVDALLRDHAPPFAPSTGLVWSVEGDAGEHVLRTTWGAYNARIVEGRVWRWQVGTDASPDLYGGRIVGTLTDAQAACFHALSLCLLGEKSDVLRGTPISPTAIADAPHIKVGDHVRCESLGNLTGVVETVNPSEVPGWDQCFVRDDREGHVWVAAAWILEVTP